MFGRCFSKYVNKISDYSVRNDKCRYFAGTPHAVKGRNGEKISLQECSKGRQCTCKCIDDVLGQTVVGTSSSDGKGSIADGRQWRAAEDQ